MCFREVDRLITWAYQLPGLRTSAFVADLDDAGFSVVTLAHLSDA